MIRPRESRAKRIVLWTIAILILLPAGYGFAEKLMLFILAVRRDLIGGFTIVPVVNYLIVTAGMVCLLLWGIAHGMFRDVERAKYDMLEREEQLEADERDSGRTTP
ncbi:MAG TPA: hypothetical protein VJZ71_17985 [Phycisphaerae bacterium]|nr:hypothetical protein [Phycisphaerae bacterium]